MKVIDFSNKVIDKIPFDNGASRFTFKTPDHEEGFLMIIRNDGGLTSKLKIKAGNSIYAMGDAEADIESGQIYVANLKYSGRFKNVYGENSGEMVVEILDGDPDALSVAVISL